MRRAADFVCLNFRDAIVTWIKKKIGPGVVNITTLDDAERILTSENKVVLGYLSSLVVCFCISSISYYFCFLAFLARNWTRDYIYTRS